MNANHREDPARSPDWLALSPGHRRNATVVKTAACAITPLILALAVLGGLGSFATVRDMARPWFGDLAWIVPLGMDVGILILLAWDLLMEYVALPWPVLRWVAWSFIGGTVAVNVMAAHGDVASALMHAAMPVLFVTVIEGIRHLIRQYVGLATGTRVERIPTVRWLLSPVSSALLWRRIALWHVPTYRQALGLELQHLTAVSRLQQQYGRWAWRWKAPLNDRVELRRLPALALGYETDPLGRSQLAAEHVPVVQPEPLPQPDGEDDGHPRTRIDAELLRAATAVVADAHQEGRRLSVAELGRQLRNRGFTVSNGRLASLRAAALQEQATDRAAKDSSRPSPASAR